MWKIRRFLLCLAVFVLFVSSVCAERLPQSKLLEFYENCVFVGDSITQQFHAYMNVKKKKEDGFSFPVKYLAAQSYMLYTASRKYQTTRGVSLTFRGNEMPLCDILQLMKPNKAFILLGVNDYAGKEIEKYIGCCDRLIDLAAQSAPDTGLVFFSLTPVTRAFCRKQDYRTMWDAYNAELEKECEARGAGYIDIASNLKDEEGYLREDYSSDGQYHLNHDGLEIWFQKLMDYAQEQYDKGLWMPKEENENE